MLIGTSKYNYYHIRANGAQKLPACIYNFSGRIYMTNHRQLPSCHIITLYTTRTQQISTTITTSAPTEPKTSQPVFITFLDGFTWLTTGRYQAVTSSRCTQQELNGTEQCHRPAASLQAPRGKLAAYHTVIIHILWAKYSVCRCHL